MRPFSRNSSRNRKTRSRQCRWRGRCTRPCVRTRIRRGVLNAHSIYYILGGEHSIPAIDATIAMLQSDLIGALATNDNGSLYTRLSPRMLNDKLTQLKDKIGGEGISQSSPT